MKIKFDEANHKYYLGKKELTSITTLLKRHGLSTDFGEVMISPAVLEEARNRGNLIHKEIEEYIKENKYPTTKEAKQIIDFYNSIPNKKTNVECEKIIHNEEFAGKKDLSFYVGAVKILTDTKTGKKIDITACSWQLSLYEYLEKIDYDRLLIFHTPKDADFKVIELTRIPKEEIEKLLECERNCEIYNAPKAELATISSEISNKISTGLKAIKRIEQELADYKEKILAEMRDKGIKKFDNGEVSITYIEPTTRETIDTKALKSDLPEIAEKYKKISNVKDSIKITIKGE